MGSLLHDKIRGGLMGAAIGDAMGGPVEGMDFRDIERAHGRVSTLLPYTTEPAEHNHWANQPGSVTDDTRMAWLVASTLLESRGEPSRGDLGKAFAEYFHAQPEGLARAFIEEYYLKSLYGSRKLAYGGQPTNGALMGNSPVGLVNPADPRRAFSVAYELAFITDGYAKESAGMGAAAVAAAMAPHATTDAIVGAALDAADWFRRDGPRWTETIRRHAWARFEGRPNHELVQSAVDLARREGDVWAIRAPLYEALEVSPVGSEAGQTLAVALAMVVASDGDFMESVTGAVNYGRDCDSYAAVAGAIAGALQGATNLPPDLVETVKGANREFDFDDMATKLATLVTARHVERRSAVEAVDALLGTPERGPAPS